MALRIESLPSRGGMLAVLFGVLGIGIFFGWALGTGVTGLSIYVLESVLLLVLTLYQLSFGIFIFLLLMHVVPLIPASLRLPGVALADVYVFGLNVSNLVLLILMVSWGIRFVASRQGFRPLGPFGKLVVLHMAWITFSLLRTLMLGLLLPGQAHMDRPTALIAVWRSNMIVPVISFLIMQTAITPRYFIAIIRLYMTVMIIGIIWGLSPIVNFSGEIGLISAQLRRAAVDIALLVPFFGVVVVLFVVSKKALPRMVWIALACIAVLPVAYLRRRGIYLTTAIELIMASLFLVKLNRRYAFRVAVLLLITVAAGVLFMPHVVFDRIAYSYAYDPVSHEYVVDSSIEKRFIFWRVALDVLKRQWWMIPWGHGLGMSRVFMRDYIGRGMSVHNFWLQSLVDFGVIGVAIIIAVYVAQFRICRAMWRASNTLVMAFGISLAAFIIADQGTKLAHTFAFTGELQMMVWVISALATTQLRPGGILAESRLPDGRLGKELLGYSPDAVDDRDLGSARRHAPPQRLSHRPAHAHPAPVQAVEQRRQ